MFLCVTHLAWSRIVFPVFWGHLHHIKSAVHGSSKMRTIRILFIFLAYQANSASSFSHQEIAQAAPINRSSTNVSSPRVPSLDITLLCDILQTCRNIFVLVSSLFLTTFRLKKKKTTTKSLCSYIFLYRRSFLRHICCREFYQLPIL